MDHDPGDQVMRVVHGQGGFRSGGSDGPCSVTSGSGVVSFTDPP